MPAEVPMSRVDDLIAKGAVQVSRKYRQVYVPSGGYTVDLTEADFAEFYEKTTGKKLWSAEDKTPCKGCGSFGHMHRHDCSQSLALSGEK
jgi:hypothetical protein